MVNVLARSAAQRLAGATLSLIGLFSSAVALAQNEPTFKDPQPFEAQYRLEVRGWPGATITHRLSNEGSHWLSDMRFSIAVVRGQELSRFSPATTPLTHCFIAAAIPCWAWAIAIS